MLKRHPAILCSALLLALSQLALSQTPDEPGGTDELTVEDCQVQPDEDGAPDLSEEDEDIDPFPPEDDAADDESLTEKLDPCNGVLKPPEVGDQEMTTPPPDEGETPIIRPGELPEQPPSDG
jgi:hypothetical protein